MTALELKQGEGVPSPEGKGGSAPMEGLFLIEMVRSSRDAIICEDISHQIMSWNPAAERIYGYSSEETVGHSIDILAHPRPGDVPAINELILKGGSVEDFETRRVTKDGRTVFVTLSISPIKDSDGKVVGISEISHDITARTVLNAERLRLASIVDSSEDAIICLDLDGIVTSWNPGAEKMFGYNSGETIGHSLQMIYEESDRHELMDTISRIKIGKHVDTFETRRKRKNGTLIEVSLSISPIKNESGEVVGVSRIMRDITVQKDATQYVRNLIDANLDPLFTLGPDGKIMDVNAAAIRATGRPRLALIGSDFTSLFSDLEEARFMYEEAFKYGSVRDYPLSFRHSSGVTTDVFLNATVFNNADGKVKGIFASARDSTEEKKKEQQLHTTAAYVRSLFEATIDPLTTISPDGKITDLNHATELITGVTREWLIGTDYTAYFTEPGRARQGYRRTFKEGVVRDYPLVIRHLSGRLTSVLYNASTFIDATGKIMGVLAAMHDVTETKNASQYARSLFEASLDPLVTIGPGGKIMDVNEAAVDVTGVPRESLVGSDFSSYFTQPESARQMYEEVFQNGLVHDLPLTIKSTNGQLKDVLYNGSVYKDSEGAVLGVFAAARDFTSQKHAAQQLEATNKELEAFSYSVSHDLRAPLRAIDGFSKILSDDYSEHLDDEGKRIVSVIRRSATQMGTLIDDLLTMSRLERSEMSREDVDMKEMVTDVFNEVKTGFPAGNIEFTVGKIPHALVDRSLFRHVWTNLLSNALKFTRGKDPQKIQVGSSEDNGSVIFSVKDNGVGFDMKYAGKLFQVFTRLNNAQEFEGTGIGLAIVQRIVARHGGRVWAEGVVGEGSTFYVALPLRGGTS